VKSLPGFRDGKGSTRSSARTAKRKDAISLHGQLVFVEAYLIVVESPNK